MCLSASNRCLIGPALGLGLILHVRNAGFVIYESAARQHHVHIKGRETMNWVQCTRSHPSMITDVTDKSLNISRPHFDGAQSSREV